ncbi:PREDICTED: transposon CACTA En/Spm, partial [Prunus dulcis]
GGSRTRIDAQTNTWMESRILLSLHVDTNRHLEPSRVDNVEPIVDPNDQVMGIIQDFFPFASTNINQEGEDDVPTPIDSAEFEQLQRLYMSTHTATDMRWHKEKRVDDDVMRHPADGEAWKEFDRAFPEFAADPRN